jgi:hypothetical protein
VRGGVEGGVRRKGRHRYYYIFCLKLCCVFFCVFVGLRQALVADAALLAGDFMKNIYI